MRALSRALSAAILIMLAGIYIEVPGPWRALTPGAFGLAEIGPGIFTDAPGDAGRIRDLVRRSREKAEALFGRGGWQPTYVICTTEDCTRTFGFESAGLTVGYHFVLIAPSGLNDEVMLHERIHVELHRRMGPFDFIRPRFPTWFDEGLATMLSRPPRVRGRDKPADAQWVTEGQTWTSWHHLKKAHGIDDMYNAAAVMVGALESRVGRSGLFHLIAEVGKGADFNSLYAQAMRG